MAITFKHMLGRRGDICSALIKKAGKSRKRTSGHICDSLLFNAFDRFHEWQSLLADSTHRGQVLRQSRHSRFSFLLHSTVGMTCMYKV